MSDKGNTLEIIQESPNIVSYKNLYAIRPVVGEVVDEEMCGEDYISFEHLLGILKSQIDIHEYTVLTSEEIISWVEEIRDRSKVQLDLQALDTK